MLQGALFDLDGTLLEVRDEHFMQEYFQAIARAVAPVMDVDRFTKALMDSVVVMLMNRDPSSTNADVFWHEFSSRMGNSREALEPLLITSMQRFDVIYPAAGSAHFALPITFAKLQAIGYLEFILQLQVP